MSLVKTDQGRTALQQRDARLCGRDRQILILADGARSATQIAGLVVGDAQASIDRLLAWGMLAQSGATRVEHAGHSASIMAKSSIQVSAQPSATAGSPASANSSIDPKPLSGANVVKASNPQTGRRRSLAATKMYCIDMLLLQRSMDTSALAVDIQSSQTEDELVNCVLHAMAQIQSNSGPAYAFKVMARLEEVMPTSHLPRLQAQMAKTQTEIPPT
jgi:hypothetical protein